MEPSWLSPLLVPVLLQSKQVLSLKTPSQGGKSVEQIEAQSDFNFKAWSEKGAAQFDCFDFA